jgi:hypothetical protein
MRPNLQEIFVGSCFGHEGLCHKWPYRVFDICSRTIKWDQYSRYVVHPRTSITMSARSNLEVERTVHAILFSAKYKSQILRHDSLSVQQCAKCPNFYLISMARPTSICPQTIKKTCHRFCNTNTQVLPSYIYKQTRCVSMLKRRTPCDTQTHTMFAFIYRISAINPTYICYL